MNKKITLLLIIFSISSFMCFSNEYANKLNNYNISFSNSFSLKNNITPFSLNTTNGKVASDKEEIQSETFHLFRRFRDASIGMFIPGTLIGSTALIGTFTTYFVGSTFTGLTTISTGLTTISELMSNTIYMACFYAMLGIGILGSIFLVCGVAFAAAAGGLYYKWAKSRELTAFNSLDTRKPAFAQGFVIAL